MGQDRIKNIFFIGGVPRSGTSLVQKILDGHSNIYAGPEFDHLPSICTLFHNMKRGIENGRQVFYYDRLILEDSFKQFIWNILISKAERENVMYISEKTPSNLFVFDELNQIFPNAKFIIVLRDPRDCLVSFKKVNEKAKEFGDDIDLGKDLYKDLNFIIDYVDHGERFYLNNKSKRYLIKYEKLITNPIIEIKSLCRFLNISFEESMLELHKNINDASKLINASHKTVRAWSYPGMLDSNVDSSNHEKWKIELSKLEKGLINNFFSVTRSEFFKEYNFKALSFMDKVKMIPSYIKKFGLKKLLLRQL